LGNGPLNMFNLKVINITAHVAEWGVNNENRIKSTYFVAFSLIIYAALSLFTPGAGCIKKWLKLTMVKCKRHPIRSAYLRVNHYLTTK
jgi:hypothetical protein